MATDFYLELVTPATTQPISMQELKDQLSYDEQDTENDRYLNMILKSAVDQFEKRTHQVTMERTLRLTHYAGECIELPGPPFVSLTSFKGKEDLRDAFEDMAVDDYTLIEGRTPAEVVVWSPLPYHEAVYVCGYDDAENVPDDWKLAILQIATFIHENRGDVPAEFPVALNGIINSCCTGTVAGYWYL